MYISRQLKSDRTLYGNGEWGMGHGAWGIGHFPFSLSPFTAGATTGGKYATHCLPFSPLQLPIKQLPIPLECEGDRIRKDGSHFWANIVITALRVVAW